MRFQDTHWMEVENYLKSDNRVILITGATEQHAYLSLLTDIIIPLNIAQEVSQRTGVLVAPPLNFGVSDEFVDFPGTISLSRATFDAILSEIVESLLQQGFTRFFILNGHGGNQLPPRLEDLMLDGVIRLVWYNWWRSEAAQAFEQRYGLRIDHANWGENFPFNRVAPCPDEDKTPVNLAYLEEGQTLRKLLGDGSFGGRYQVDDVLMNTLFESVVEEVCSKIVQM